MAKRKDAAQAAPAGDAATPGPGPTALAAAVGLAALSALWALFQWMQLLIARTGGESFCGLGDPGSCVAVWDSPLARAVQGLTGMPVAGLGLVWSVTALVLPLAALARRAGGRPLEPFASGTLVTGLAGLAAVVVLAAASLSAGQLCTTCAVTYALVLAYAIVAWRSGGGLARLRLVPGAGAAAAVTAGAFLALLVPGLRTPAAPWAAGSAAIERAADAASPARAIGSAADGELGEMIRSLSPPQRQGLADALAVYAGSGPLPEREPRALHGPAAAPIRITEFTDTLCSHCATLHGSLEQLRALAGPDTFAVDSRHFPLDGACNPHIRQQPESSVRCAAARARICMEGRRGAEAFDHDLYARQRSLDVERIYELAAPYLERDALEACMASPETDAKLAADIAWAAELGIRGTPLVLVNGRRGSAFAPFLYAMLLTGGDARHPAFDALPPPRVH